MNWTRERIDRMPDHVYNSSMRAASENMVSVPQCEAKQDRTR